MRPQIILVASVLALLPACKWIAAKTITAFTEVIRWSDGLTKGTGEVSADGRLQTGPWKFYYRDGRLRSEGAYAKDVQVGPWKFYYENGNIEWEGTYDTGGVRTGLWRFYHDNGTKRAEGDFVDDREHGLWRFWDRDGKPTQEGDFERGRLAGWWTYQYPDGSTKAQGLHFEGVRVGPWRFFDERGEESMEDRGLPAGARLVQETWPNGTRRRMGLMRGDAPVGGWVTFHDNGTLRARAVRDQADGRAWSIGDQDGRLVACGRIAGKQFVDMRVWTEAGMLDDGREPVPQLAPGSTAEWSPAGLVNDKPIAEVAATWLAEMSTPLEPASSSAPTPPTLVLASPPPSLVAPVDANPRIVAAPQPSFTVRELEELPAIIKEYTEGKTEKRAGADRYAIPKARQGKPRRRDDLEGKPFPVATVSVADGPTLSLMDLRGKKGFVVAVMRGFKGSVCVYCVAQTKALAQCKAEFDALGVDVLVVYPGQKGNEQAFLTAYAEESDELKKNDATIPYRVVMDADLQLVAALGIEGGDLAFPTTMYVDSQGVIRWAYTGQNRADRPPAQQIIEFIKKSGS